MTLYGHAQGMRSDRWTGAWTGAHILACTHGLGMPKPVFSESPLLYSRACTQRHIRHRNGGEVGMHNSVQESGAAPRWSKVKTALGSKQLRCIATHYGIYAQNTRSYGVSAAQLRRPANPTHTPYSWNSYLSCGHDPRVQQCRCAPRPPPPPPHRHPQHTHPGHPSSRLFG